MQRHPFFLYVLLVLVSAKGISQTTYNLQNALQTARKNNQALKSEYYAVAIAASDIETAKLRPNPIFGFNYIGIAGQKNYAPNTGFFNNANTQANLQVGKVFQLFGTRKNKIEFASQNTTAAQKSYTEAERTLFQDVGLKWVDVWAAQKQLEIIKKANNNIDSLLIINKVRLKNQVISQTDFNRTSLLSNQYGLQIRSLEQNLKNELVNLKYLLGTQEEINIDANDDFSFIIPADLEAFLQKGLIERSDVLTAKSIIETSNANIKLQKSLAYPQPELGVIYNPQNMIPYVGVYGTIELPFFSRNQGEIKKSNYIKQQAEQSLQTTNLQVQTEVTNAFNAFETQKKNVQNFDSLLSQSENILKSVKYSYLRGGTTIIDFLEAQRSWLDIQQQYYDTMQQYRTAYIKLLYASGLINQIAQ
ncbi:outer membrane protein, cobalt-zinc-cadmium efflux system [Flavobacterium sp. CF108]|uniref:TolC family protein n=1 Tax=unclassified Flavobacterium TaxID=196869 RepID=UPI0008C4C9CE|nr:MULTISPECIES: TolC family protein [unclassified Flavobacterium]SEO18496.1 outer membrane protein, cobalt-zinc-cadmium efflux system [Flavobacterium sp. fv08]SHG54693.1 outer membrane protein, cobalt-zinc-cadmium efflux system [Flavobacterium sp. CF108]